tara:strand:+ start:405 stop:575 length:171 start_codon:yes stop_codon:yes gene_type:complete
MKYGINNKSQAFLYYALLIAFVSVALFVMSGYLKRRIMGTYKAAGDAYGEGEQSNW